jgi:hypothetical protein
MAILDVLFVDDEQSVLEASRDALPPQRRACRMRFAAGGPRRASHGPNWWCRSDACRSTPCRSRACSLLGWLPLDSTGIGYIGDLLPLMLATEAWLLIVNHPYNDRRRRQRRPIRAPWHVRIMWSGMAPIYMKASIQALLGGPNRKPVYKVTRKHDDPRWHWRHTLPQTTLVLIVVFVMLYALRHGTLPSASLLAGAVYRGGLNIVLLSGFVTRGWHGLAAAKQAINAHPPGAGATPPSVAADA